MNTITTTTIDGADKSALRSKADLSKLTTTVTSQPASQPKKKPRKRNKGLKKVVQAVNRVAIEERDQKQKLKQLQQDQVYMLRQIGDGKVCSESFSTVIHNIFDPDSPVGNSFADGSDVTCVSESMITTTVTVSPGAYANIAIVPYSVAQNIMVIGNGTSNTSFQNPFAVGAGLVSTLYGTPYSSSANVGPRRVNRCHVNIFPTSSMMNANGNSMFAYIPNLLDPSALGILSDNLTGFSFAGSAQTRLAQETIKRAYGFGETLEMHWFPNNSELAYSPTSDACSGFLGYIYNGGTVANTYFIEITIGIEYMPTFSIMPFVHPSLSTINPACKFEVNQFIAQNKSLILSTPTERAKFFQPFPIRLGRDYVSPDHYRDSKRSRMFNVTSTQVGDELSIILPEDPNFHKGSDPSYLTAKERTLEQAVARKKLIQL